MFFPNAIKNFLLRKFLTEERDEVTHSKFFRKESSLYSPHRSPEIMFFLLLEDETAIVIRNLFVDIRNLLNALNTTWGHKGSINSCNYCGATTFCHRGGARGIRRKKSRI